MSQNASSDITRLLHEWNAGSEEAQEELWPILYGELKVVARSALRRQAGSGHQTTSLVNQAYLRLLGADVDWNDRRHFYAVASRAMRFLLVEEARRRMSKKRGGEELRDAVVIGEDVLDVHDPAASNPEEIVAIHQALERLAEINPRYVKLVELRYFAGLSVEDTAASLEVTPRTVVRDWKTVRLWLMGELGEASEDRMDE